MNAVRGELEDPQIKAKPKLKQTLDEHGPNGTTLSLALKLLSRKEKVARQAMLIAYRGDI